MDKIITLLKSNTYEDVYIGLSLLDRLNYKRASKVLRLCGFTYANYSDTGWFIERDIIGGAPNFLEYIEGRLYFYSIRNFRIDIDLKKHVKTVQKRDPKNIIKESWK